MAARIRKKTPWLCQVATSDVRFGGTDANVFIKIYGSDGETDEIPLESKSQNFQRSQVDDFKLEINDIGCLRKLRVWHDNKFVYMYFNQIQLLFLTKKSNCL